MKALLLATAFSAPLAALAQQAAEDRLSTRLDTVAALTQTTKKKSPPVFSPLKFSEGYIIARPALLYRKMSDVRSGHYAYRLRPGDAVFRTSLKSNRQWLRVVREPSEECISKCDTTIYYLSTSAIQPKSGAPVKVFTLH